MATGDSADILGRLKRLLPPWFADSNPVLDALLRGFAASFAFIYSLIAFAQLQTRILTATGGWLDLIANDFFANGLPRGGDQTDAVYRRRILINMFRERGTRAALRQVLVDLTGEEPVIFEPARVQDTGAYGGPHLGYGVAGAYGSLLLPYQAFVTAFRPRATGIPFVAGYGVSSGGYGVASRAEYASLGMIEHSVTDQEIYDAIDSVKVAGTIVWTRIAG